MPCYDERDSPSYIRENQIKPLQARNDELAKMLCGLCRILEKDKIGYQIPRVHGLLAWWTAHQEQDRIREAREKAEKKKQEEKEIAQLKALKKKYPKV